MTIHPVWSVFAVHFMGSLFMWTQQRLGSDWADLMLRWAHMSFGWFCHALLKLYLLNVSIIWVALKLSLMGALKCFAWNTIMILSFLWQTGRIRSVRSCHSVCICWMHYCMLKCHCSILWPLQQFFVVLEFFSFLRYWIFLLTSCFFFSCFDVVTTMSYFRNKFHFSKVHRSMNVMGPIQS